MLVITGCMALKAGWVFAGTFPDYGFAPPSTYSGPRFQLSQDYPTLEPQTSLPEFFAQLPSPLTVDFERWRPYVASVKRYCLEGNAENDWEVQKNSVRRWYHAPWQHYGPQGREGIHGLTKEAKVPRLQLASTQHTEAQTYAVGIYNDRGGFTFGRVWRDPQRPDLSVTSDGRGFPDGAVVCKALFTDASVDQVPYLAHPVLWQAYVTNTFDATQRSIKPLALIQMDFAVRDSRIPGTGWLFGTFQYNGAIAKAASWDNLVPVGVTWGNDPKQKGNRYTNPRPVVTRINPKLEEVAINRNRRELPPTHLGWNGRLNGPVDNPLSSCMSCHMTGEVPQRSPMHPTFQAADKVPAVGSPEWMRWFQNLPAATPFDPGAESTDFSLQLAAGVANFYQAKCAFPSGAEAVEACPSSGVLQENAKSGQPTFNILRGPGPGD